MFEGDIICERVNGEAVVNIPQRIVYHSPDGFEWGYGGSGPSDLALNILYLFVDRDTALRLHQKYKWDVVAKMPKEGGRITRESVIAWLKVHGVEVTGPKREEGTVYCEYCGASPPYNYPCPVNAVGSHRPRRVGQKVYVIRRKSDGLTLRRSEPLTEEEIEKGWELVEVITY